MNNKEKRKMEGELGLLKVKKQLRFDAWAEEVGKNIEYGKNKHDEIKEIRRLQEKEAEDRINAIRISYIVDELTSKGMNLIDAQEKATEIYNEQQLKK